MKKEIFTSHDGKAITLYIWDEVIGEKKGIIQIVHGMVEHMGRYDDFAGFLNAAGFIVAGDDHRAHGDTDKDNLGKYVPGEKAGTDSDLFEDTVKDELAITDLLKERYKLPLILFGHSYGSFLTQRYMTIDTSKLAGAVLCGSALQGGAIVNIGKSIAKKACKKNAGEPGYKLNAMMFKAYDRKFREGKNAWLNRDVEEVGKYNLDPYCSFVCSNAFYYSFFGGIKTIEKSDNSAINKNLKLHITSGDKDMVGKCGKLVKKLYEKYKRLGLQPSLKLYPGARHEIVNETNKQEVYDDILKFAESCL